MTKPFQFKTYPSAKTRWTHFAINLILAFWVITVLLVMENTIFFKEQRDYLLDWVMYWHSGFTTELDTEALPDSEVLVQYKNQPKMENG